jgi:Holliday junction resolvase
MLSSIPDILKFLTQKGVATSRGNQTTLKQCVTTYLKSKKMLISDYKGSLKERIKIRTEAIKKLKDICLGG